MIAFNPISCHISRPWNNTRGLRHANKVIEVSSRKTKVILALEKKELRILTGFCPLRYHLNKIGLVENDGCRLSGTWGNGEARSVQL